MSHARTKKLLESKPNTSVKKLFKQGVYCRLMQDTRAFEKELTLLAANTKIIQQRNIDTPDELRKFYTEKEAGVPSAKLLRGFVLRPMTLLLEGASIGVYHKLYPGIILNPQSVLATHFYKRNSMSAFIKVDSNRFVFAKPLAGLKDTGTYENLTTKLKEMDNTRCGREYGKKNKYYFSETLSHNEVLAHYTAEDIIGFIVPRDPGAAKTVMKWQTILSAHTGTTYDYFYYSPAHADLVQIPASEIASWAEEKSLINTHPSLPPLPSFLPENIFSREKHSLLSVTCSLSEHEPSAAHPITYTFTYQYSDQEVKTGECRFNKRIPVIQIDGNAYHCRDTAIFIAEQHQVNLIEVCNTYLQRDDVKQHLGVSDITLRTNTSFRVLLSYTPMHAADTQAETVLNNIGYPSDRLKWTPTAASKPEAVEILLHVNQALDAIKNSLAKVAEELAPAQGHSRKRKR